MTEINERTLKWFVFEKIHVGNSWILWRGTQCHSLLAVSDWQSVLPILADIGWFVCANSAQPKKITGVGCVTLMYNVHQHLSVPTVPSHQSQLLIWMCEGHIFWWCFQPMAQFSCLFTFYLAAMIFIWGLELTIGWMAFECVSLVCCDQGVDWQLLSMPESEPFFAWAQSFVIMFSLGCTQTLQDVLPCM